MVKSDPFTRDFLEKSVEFLVQNDLDGMNFEFEGSDIPTEDFDEIVNFMQKLRKKCDNVRLQLTISFHMSQHFLAREYKFLSLTETVDFITFNPKYNTENFNYTIDDARKDRGLGKNIEKFREWFWVPPSKMLIGLQFGGPRFNHIETDDGIKSNTFDKMLNYNDIFIATTERNWNASYDTFYNMLTMSNETIGQTITFESPYTFVHQIRSILHQVDVAGIFTGLLNDDNYLGKCQIYDDAFLHYAKSSMFPSKWKDNTFPLLKTVNDAIKLSLDERNWLGIKIPKGREVGISRGEESSTTKIFAPAIRIQHKPIIPSQKIANTEEIKLIRQSEYNKPDSNSIVNDEPANGMTVNDISENEIIVIEIPTNYNTPNNTQNNSDGESDDNGTTAVFRQNAHYLVFGVIINLIYSISI